MHITDGAYTEYDLSASTNKKVHQKAREERQLVIAHRSTLEKPSAQKYSQIPLGNNVYICDRLSQISQVFQDYGHGYYVSSALMGIMLSPG